MGQGIEWIILAYKVVYDSLRGITMKKLIALVTALAAVLV
jgi:hypothetical protein